MPTLTPDYFGIISAFVKKHKVWICIAGVLLCLFIFVLPSKKSGDGKEEPIKSAGGSSHASTPVSEEQQKNRLNKLLAKPFELTLYPAERMHYSKIEFYGNQQEKKKAITDREKLDECYRLAVMQEHIYPQTQNSANISAQQLFAMATTDWNEWKDLKVTAYGIVLKGMNTTETPKEMRDKGYVIFCGSLSSSKSLNVFFKNPVVLQSGSGVCFKGTLKKFVNSPITDTLKGTDTKAVNETLKNSYWKILMIEDCELQDAYNVHEKARSSGLVR